MQKPSPQHWNNLAIGRSDFHLSATVNSRDNTIGIWLNITGTNAKENYDRLFDAASHNSLIEVSDKLVWSRMDDNKQSAIILTAPGDFQDRSKWENQFKWFQEYLEAFTNYFKPIIKNL